MLCLNGHFQLLLAGLPGAFCALAQERMLPGRILQRLGNRFRLSQPLQAQPANSSVWVCRQDELNRAILALHSPSQNPFQLAVLPLNTVKAQCIFIACWDSAQPLRQFCPQTAQDSSLYLITPSAWEQLLQVGFRLSPGA